MYDLANQSFTLLIITLLFSLYFKDQVAALAVQRGLDQLAADNRGDFIWSLVHGSSFLVVVALSPLLGAAADARTWRKEILIGTGGLCALLTVSLGFVPSSALVVVALLYFIANVCYQIGENFLASFLPDISTPTTIGRVSATGWTMGYVGALLLLLFVTALMLIFGWKAPSQYQPFFIFAGVWFAAGMIPAMLYVREKKRPVHIRGGIVRESFARVLETMRHAQHYRQLVLFLIAFLVYGFGVQVVIAFASILAKRFGFVETELVLFVLQITITAGIAAVLTGLYQDRIGTKRTIMFYLMIWFVSAVWLTWLTTLQSAPKWPLWVVGNGLGLGLGGIGTSSRSMVGLCTPRHRAAEFFGLWGLTYKLAAAIGVLAFGAVTELLGDTGAMVLLASFFAVGFLLILPVNERQGIEAARAAERQHASNE